MRVLCVKIQRQIGLSRGFGPVTDIKLARGCMIVVVKSRVAPADNRSIAVNTAGICVPTHICLGNAFGQRAGCQRQKLTEEEYDLAT